MKCDNKDTSQYGLVCGCITHNGFLTRAGYRALDRKAGSGYIDSMVSVSGPRRDEENCFFDEELIDEQYRRFLDGSEEGLS